MGRRFQPWWAVHLLAATLLLLSFAAGCAAPTPAMTPAEQPTLPPPQSAAAQTPTPIAPATTEPVSAAKPLFVEFFATW